MDHPIILRLGLPSRPHTPCRYRSSKKFRDLARGQLCVLLKDDEGVIRQAIGTRKLDDGQWHVIEFHLAKAGSGPPRVRVVVDGLPELEIGGSGLGVVANDAAMVIGSGGAQGKGHFFRGKIEGLRVERMRHRPDG